MTQRWDSEEQTEENPRKQRVKWAKDAKGRDFLLEGTVRVYRRAEDRDAAVEESYELSPVVRLTLGNVEPSIFYAVARETVALAELFHREAAQMKREIGTTDDQIDLWCRVHFGRTLEASLRGMLAYEIRRTLALGAGGRRGPSPGFKDYAEQRAYERAAEDAPPYVPGDGAALARVHAIAVAAGAVIGPGLRDMPDAPIETA